MTSFVFDYSDLLEEPKAKKPSYEERSQQITSDFLYGRIDQKEMYARLKRLNEEVRE